MRGTEEREKIKAPWEAGRCYTQNKRHLCGQMPFKQLQTAATFQLDSQML